MPLNDHECLHTEAIAKFYDRMRKAEQEVAVLQTEIKAVGEVKGMITELNGTAREFSAAVNGMKMTFMGVENELKTQGEKIESQKIAREKFEVRFDQQLEKFMPAIKAYGHWQWIKTGVKTWVPLVLTVIGTTVAVMRYMG